MFLTDEKPTEAINNIAQAKPLKTHGHQSILYTRTYICAHIDAYNDVAKKLKSE